MGPGTAKQVRPALQTLLAAQSHPSVPGLQLTLASTDRHQGT
jgi:hypothetical protein